MKKGVIELDEVLQTILKEIPQSPSWLAARKVAEQIRNLHKSEKNLLPVVKAALLSSFTAEPLADFAVIEAARQNVYLDLYSGGYGQFNQEILSSDSGLYQHAPEITFLLLEPQALLSLDTLTLESVDHLLFEMSGLIKPFAANSAAALVVSTFLCPPSWPLHVLPTEVDKILQQANDRLRNEFAEVPQVQILDLNSLAAYYGYQHALSPQMLAMARLPFSEGFLILLARKMLSHVLAVKGRGKKCLVLDCDNTLWGGIIGEDSMEGIQLGPDWPGREFLDFQKAIFELTRQGVILAINSKNNERDVMKVLREHPHMLLRESCFAGIQINWDPKPENMKRLAEQMNIGLDSMVFVDDNPAEQEMMRQMLPEVTVLDLPDNPALYARTLRETNLFTQAFLTEEDKQRGQIYAAQRQRSELQKSVPTLEDYLRSLQMVCCIRLAQGTDIKRASQLTQRTNQFNLTTRRYSETDIRQRIESPDWNIYVLGLKDRFGDNGTVGLALVEKETNTWRIDTFLMSCRVIGRQAEDALVDRICRDAAAAGAKELQAQYLQTQKNTLVKDFWDRMGFRKVKTEETSSFYTVDLEEYIYKEFEYIELE